MNYVRDFWFSFLQQKVGELDRIPEQAIKIKKLEEMLSKKSDLNPLILFLIKRILYGKNPKGKFIQLSGRDNKVVSRVSPTQVYFLADMTTHYTEATQFLFNFTRTMPEPVGWYIYQLVNRVNIFGIPLKALTEIYDKFYGSEVTEFKLEDLTNYQLKIIRGATEKTFRSGYGRTYPAIYFPISNRYKVLKFIKQGDHIETTLSGQDKLNLQSAVANISCVSLYGYTIGDKLYCFLCSYNKQLAYDILNNRPLKFGKYQSLIMNLGSLTKTIKDMNVFTDIKNLQRAEGVALPDTISLLEYMEHFPRGAILYKNGIDYVKNLTKDYGVLKSVDTTSATMLFEMLGGKDLEASFKGLLGVAVSDLPEKLYKKATIYFLNKEVYIKF